MYVINVTHLSLKYLAVTKKGKKLWKPCLPTGKQGFPERGEFVGENRGPFWLISPTVGKAGNHALLPGQGSIARHSVEKTPTCDLVNI